MDTKNIDGVFWQEKIPQDIKHTIFDILVENPLSIFNVNCCDYGQREVIRYIFCISQLNKHYNSYIKSFEYIRKFLTSIKNISVKYHVACNLLLRSYQSPPGSLAKCAKYFDVKDPHVEITKLRGIARYVYCSLTVCCKIYSLSYTELENFLKAGADPNFYIDQGHCCDNVPAAMIRLATSNSKNSNKKMHLLMQYGADINLKQSCTVLLERNGLSNTCLIYNPTPLAIAIKWDNRYTVKTILTYNPKKLWAQEAFLSIKSKIKKLILNHPSLSQEDLDEALVGALSTQNQEDIEILLQKGANPHKQLPNTINRTINHCLYPERYQSYNRDWATPGTLVYRGNNSYAASMPIPSLNIAQLLCQHGAYDANIVECLKNLHETTERLLEMLEANKPS